MKNTGLYGLFVIFLSTLMVACGGSSYNAPPLASAGAEQTVNEKTNVNLDGRNSSDMGGSIAAYAWTQVSGEAVILTNAASATPSFLAPSVANAEGSKTLVFKLKVTDDGGATDEDTVSIIIRAVNSGVDAYAGENQKVTEASTVRLASTGSGEDGGAVSYKWVQISGTAVTLTGANTATPLFTAPAASVTDSNNLLEFRLTVTDSAGITATDTVIVVVGITNKAPVANAGSDLEVGESVKVTLSGSATDANKDALSYSWIQTGGSYAVLLSSANTATPFFTSPEVTATSTLTFTLTVNDGHGGTATDSVNITVKNTPNVAPVANAGRDQSVNEKLAVTLDGSDSSDADGSIVDYEWRQTSGPSVTLANADREKAAFTAPAVISGSQTLLFKLTVTDNLGKEAEDTVSITVNAVNDPPVANAGADQEAYEGATVRLSGGGTDADGDTLTYSWAKTSGSAAITLVNAATATPSFVLPEVSTDTPLVFTLTVNDGKGASATDTVTVVAKNLTITDAALKSCLGSPLPSGVELSKRTSFSCTGVDLSAANLAELAKLTSLQTLQLVNARISNIAPLASLGGLTSLDLSSNTISDISVLSALPNLSVLKLSSTNIDSADLVSLSSLSALRELHLGNNVLANLDGIAGLTGLVSLQLPSATLNADDLAKLSSMANLNELNLNGNQITDLSKVPNLGSLRNLYLASNGISSLAGMPALTGLERLYLSSNRISDVTPLNVLSGLDYLIIEQNCIASFAALSGISGLDIYGDVAGEGGGQLALCPP